MPLFMPLNCRIHFKTAFDFVANDDNDPMKIIRSIIYKWVKNHNAVGADDGYELYQTWFMKGDSEQHNINKAFIRTAANYGRYSKDSPEHWVMEFIHEDNSFSYRLWSVNVGLARIDEKQARFSCIVKYAIKENYIGNIPELPVSTVPKFIRSILDSPSGKCCRDISPIYGDYTEITIKTIDDFLTNIQNKNRHLPFVIIPIENDAEDELSPKKIQRHIVGNANVFVLAPDAFNRFNEIMPYKLRLRKDMIRVYFNIRENDDGYRHRFFLLEDGEIPRTQIKENIITALARNVHNFKPNELSEIKQIMFFRNQFRIEQLKNSTTENDKDEMIALCLKEIEYLEKENSENKELLQVYDEENQSLKERDRLNQWKLSVYQQSESENKKLREQLEAVSKKFSLPENIFSCLSLAEELYPSRIVVHDNAKKSAKNFAKKMKMPLLPNVGKYFLRLHLTYTNSSLKIIVQICVMSFVRGREFHFQ